MWILVPLLIVSLLLGLRRAGSGDARAEGAPAYTSQTPWIGRIRKAVDSGFYGNRSFEVLPGSRHALARADTDALYLRDGPGTRHLPWGEVPPSGIYRLAAPLRLDPPERISLASYGMLHGLTEEAARQLSIAWESAAPSQRADLFESIQRLLEDRSIPEGARSQAKAQFRESLERTRSQRRQQVRERLREIPEFRRLVALRKLLESRREAARAAVRDRPDSEDTEGSLAEVQRLWNNPHRVPLPLDLRQEIADLSRLGRDYLPRLSGTEPPHDASEWEALERTDSFGIRDLDLDASDAQRRRTNRRVRAWNSSCASSAGADSVALRQICGSANALRSALGLRELAWDDRLPANRPENSTSLASALEAPVKVFAKWCSDPLARRQLLAEGWTRLNFAPREPQGWELVLAAGEVPSP